MALKTPKDAIFGPNPVNNSLIPETAPRSESPGSNQKHGSNWTYKFEPFELNFESHLST